MNIALWHAAILHPPPRYSLAWLGLLCAGKLLQLRTVTVQLRFLLLSWQTRYYASDEFRNRYAACLCVVMAPSIGKSVAVLSIE